MTVEYVDDLFGPLVGDIFWDGSVELPVLGPNVALTVGARRLCKPSDAQRDIFSKFVSRCDRDLVERMKKMLCEHVASLGHEVAEDDLWRDLSDPKVFIANGIETDLPVAIQWSTHYQEYAIQIWWRADGSLQWPEDPD